MTWNLTDHGRRYVLLRARNAPPGDARRVLTDAGVPAMWSAPGKGWLVRRDRLADLLALAQRHDVKVVDWTGREVA
ncbi:hypothetical protein MM440_12280 [Arsenicicoccus piscis]|uniref:Uncharacterized protein n=1 Tax=Arsenicicoccus piscis TaxID=673954 RepID=A0ABQ6HN72_9MICO|nr:hypothetical protein [Arsenicicoccus piscis]MCH8628522.1 hypothetical protein [Arsenicicoccus piscis]GMA19900.1 hypothetical protein GCM10025862_19210 [Arsenicicoccus piscis]